MEASSPIFADAKPAAARARTAPRGNANAPSVLLPLCFMGTGLTALLLGVAWLLIHPEILAGYHYSPMAVAVTHLFVLGWMVTVIMGAMYQLVPVALETRLYSERLAKWQFAVHVTGVTGMIWMFGTWNMKQVGHFGSVFALGAVLFVYNIARTLKRVPKWNVIAAAVASALFWICGAVTAGLLVVASKCAVGLQGTSSTGPGRVVGDIGKLMLHFMPLAAMHAHAHLGVAGFFLMLIIGVSYKLVPMFALSEIQNSRRAGWSVALLNLGLAGIYVTVLTQSRWKMACGLVVVLALALYGVEMRDILRARKRGELDWGIRYFVTALLVLFPVGLAGMFLARPGLDWTEFSGQLENVYGFLALMGVVSFAIMGMLYKIVPFLVWFGVYSPQIGRVRVPALAEMYSTRLQAGGYWAFLAGLLVSVVSILGQSQAGVRGGCALLAAAVATLAVNLGLVMSHYVRPRLQKLRPIVVKPKIA